MGRVIQAPGGLLVQAARLDDAEAISVLLLSLANRCTLYPDMRGAERFLASFTPEAVRTVIAAPAYRYLAGWIDGSLAGVIALRDNAHLFHLFVAERFQGHRIASALWADIKAMALADGNPGRFTVNSSVAAVPVYRAFGFRTSGEHMAADGIVYVPMRYPDEATAA